ncbi:hypothetical protein GCM10015536_28280 [Streptomyces griseomycini]|nr:hypothetical protein GCM10015536_28280 [Streptomyces griseomycini]
MTAPLLALLAAVRRTAAGSAVAGSHSVGLTRTPQEPRAAGRHPAQRSSREPVRSGGSDGLFPPQGLAEVSAVRLLTARPAYETISTVTVAVPGTCVASPA